MDCDKSPLLNLSLPDKCCTGTTGCDFDGSLRNVKAEPIYVQKVYDAALFNLQGLRTVAGLKFKPKLGPGARIIRVLDIRCKRFFDPSNIKNPDNLKVKPETEISGAEFVRYCDKKDVKVIGADGTPSQKLIFTDTEDCDEKGKGTPIFGTQVVKITGNVSIEIDVIYTDDCDSECKITLSADVPIDEPNPINLTNFFELCIPSVFNSAFLPRFTEFCNINCEARLATNSIMRDISITPITGEVSANLLVALCVACEKKIIVPVQLCVLSTGFPKLSAEVSPICTTFPTLFPEQIDEKKHPCRSAESLSEDE
ncbi:MAG: hypothetical protein FH753_02200 [Firmicutes bacterium]|nr:hypothetical protein [Bacillota bacterium]